MTWRVIRTNRAWELRVPEDSHDFRKVHLAFIGEDFVEVVKVAANVAKEAALEFQGILDRRHTVESTPVMALARLQLARAYVLQGDNDKARAAYRDFLALWKDADADIPILKQAKTDYAKLE
jgi:hypothetical protein